MIHLQSITFEEQGVLFQYTQTDDARKDGALQLFQSLFVGAHPDYSGELDDLKEKGQDIVKDALEDFATAPPVDLAEDDGGDEDEPGMGWSA